MTVTLSPEWAAYVEALASEGRYGTVDDIVAHALGLLRTRDEAARPLREQIARDLETGDWLSDEEVESILDERFPLDHAKDDAA